MQEQFFPFWLDVERTLEAYRTGDRSMLPWNILQSHQKQSYEQAVEVLEAIFNEPGHAALAARYRGFDRVGDRWKVDDLELFGSVVRADFRTDSDVDVLVTFEPGADWGLIEHALMEEQLAELLRRPVDLLTHRAVEHSANMMRRASILEQAVSLLSTAKPSADAERVGT